MAKKFAIGIIIKAIDKATKVFNTVGDAADRGGKRIKGFGRNWSSNVSLPLAGLSALSFKASADFDDAMLKLITQTDTSAEQMKAWKDQILDDAPKLGLAPMAMADGLLAAASAGEQGARAYETMVQAAKASGLGLGETRDIVALATSATQVYGKANLSTAESLSILLATINQGAVEADQLATVMGPSLSMAQKLGISMTEVGAGIAAFTVKGIPAAQAATQVEGLLRNLIKVTPQSAKAFDKLGYSYDDLQTSLKNKGLYQTVLDINKAAKGQAQVLARLFPDTEALNAVFQLTTDEGGKMQIAFDGVRDHAATVNEMFAKSESAGREMRRGWAQLQVTAIELGTAMQPLMMEILPALTALVRDATGLFAGMSPEMKKFIVGAVLAGIVLGPLLTGFGGLVVGIGGVVSALALIGAPALLVIAAIAAVIGMVWWFVTDWKGATKAILKYNPFSLFWLSALKLFDWLTGANTAGIVEGWIDGMVDAFEENWPKFKALFMDAVRVLLAWVPQFLLPENLKLGSIGKERSALAKQASLNSSAAAAGTAVPGASLSLRDQMRGSVDAVKQSGAMVPWNQPPASKADVTVEFLGAPPGTRVRGKADKGMGLTLDTGYAMAN